MATDLSDKDLPRSVLSRIIKEQLPDGVMVGRDAKTAFTKSATVFTMYLTTTANDYAVKAGRSTISADDVMSALDELDFDLIKPQLEKTLEVFRKEAAAKKERQAARAAAKKAQDAIEDAADDGEGEKEGGDDDEKDVENDNSDAEDEAAVEEEEEEEEEEDEEGGETGNVSEDNGEPETEKKADSEE